MEKIKIYIAAGWFDEFQDKALTKIEKLLTANKRTLEVYSPRIEMKLDGKEDKEQQTKVFLENCKHIEEADLIIASTVGKDMGTLWECGYAYSKGVPIIYTFFDKRFPNAKFNLMLARSGIACFTDYEKLADFAFDLELDGLDALNTLVVYEGDFE